MSVTITLEIPDKVVAVLQRQVYRTNADRDLDLDLRGWIDLHLSEIAIAQDLTAKTEELRKQAEEDANSTLQAAVEAERTRLLADLEP